MAEDEQTETPAAGQEAADSGDHGSGIEGRLERVEAAMSELKDWIMGQGGSPGRVEDGRPDIKAEVRVRWHCANGHLGEIFTVCPQHYGEFMGLREARVNGQRLPIPMNIRRDVQTCPRCASQAPECDNPEHAVFYRGRPGRCGCREQKVSVRLVAVS